MNSTNNSCRCSEVGYSPECPFVFLQDGKLHLLDEKNQVQPRSYMCIEDERKPSPPMFEMMRNTMPSVETEHEKMLNGPSTFETVDNYLNDHTLFPTPIVPKRTPPQTNRSSRLVDSESMMERNREILPKFASLSIGGKVLTDLSVGGYEVDLTKAAQKANQIAPLPPAKLAKIYIDTEMNFFHHFFQGLERIIGRDAVLAIVNQERYYKATNLVLLPMIEEIIKVGYERKDTSLTVFTKTVLSATFECDDDAGQDEESRGLIVAANLYGFQYIESGMELKEADLKMWLSVNYSHFRNMHFNTFKDSGMPAFAMEGVQTRYEAVPQRGSYFSGQTDPVQKNTEVTKWIKKDDYEDSFDTRSRASRKSHRPRRQEQTIGGLLFGTRRG